VPLLLGKSNGRHSGGIAGSGSWWVLRFWEWLRIDDPIGAGARSRFLRESVGTLLSLGFLHVQYGATGPFAPIILHLLRGLFCWRRIHPCWTAFKPSGAIITVSTFA